MANKKKELKIESPVYVTAEQEQETPDVTEEETETTEPEAVETEETEAKPAGFTTEKLQNFWQSFSEEKQLPSLEEVLAREITPVEIYHLLERFASLIVWNADDLTSAKTGKRIELKDDEESGEDNAELRYTVYDFGVALVATPKDLFDSERTLSDALKIARIMMKEVQRRKWNIQMAGFDKMVSAAWVKVQQLNERSKEHKIEVIDYEPREYDLNILFYTLNPTNRG